MNKRTARAVWALRMIEDNAHRLGPFWGVVLINFVFRWYKKGK
jgi:hypothetical protein